jgi:hypothetical protein
MPHTTRRNRRLATVRVCCSVFLVLFVPVVFGGCPFASDRQMTAGRFAAGKGELRVEKELYLAGEILDSDAHAKVSLVYEDENGSPIELTLESEPTIALQRSAAGAVTLQPHDATPNWLSPLAENDGATHVYVDTEKVDESQFDAIAKCLQKNLADIEADCNKQEKHGGKRTAKTDLKLASVRHYDARLHQQTDDWEKNRKVMIFIGKPGNVWLEMDVGLKGRTVTRLPTKHRIRIGIVLPGAKTILTSDPADLMNHPEMSRAEKLKAALEEHPSDLSELFDECFDFANKAIGDRFEIKMVPSWEECLHRIALARMDSDGGIPRFAAALSDEKTSFEATRVLCDAGPLARGAGDALLKSVEDGNPRAADALLGLDVDHQAIVDAIIVWLKDCEVYDTDLGPILDELYPESKAAVPYLVKLIPNVPYHACHEHQKCFETTCKLDPDSLLVQQALLDHLASPEAANRRWAAQCAGTYELPREKTVPVLTERLTDVDHRTRVAAAKSLYELGEPADDVLPTLLQELDSSGAPRTDAIHALREMGHDAEAAAPQLQRLTKDPDSPFVRREAASALKAIVGE